MRLIPFGTNGFFSSFGRETMCFAVPLGKTLIVLDAGSGMFRFAEPVGRKLLEGTNEIHLFLSHYHLDHTFGLYAAFRFFEGKRVKVFAPEGDQEFSEFISTADFPEKHVKKYPNFSWVMLKDGKIQVSGYQVSVREQKHRNVTSLAYRYTFPDGKSLAYVTDSEATKEGVEFVRGVDILLHEHYFSGPDKMVGGHVSTIGAATIAKEAGVGTLVLIHHNPFFDEKELEKQLKIAQKLFPKTSLAQDLKRISF